MQVKKYHKLREELIEDAFEVSNKKGQDYTLKSDDALKNFKEVAHKTGLTPYQVLGVYMTKHQDAISSFIKHNGQLESEPIKERIIDNINYLCLLWGLIVEKHPQQKNIKSGDRYELKVDIEGLGKKGSLFTVPSGFEFFEFVNNGSVHTLELPYDERIEKVNEQKQGS